MDILINTHDYNHEKDVSLIFEKVKACFSQEFPEKEFEWKHSGTIFSTSKQLDEKEITRVFEELVNAYPKLKVEASCSYNVREDDRSAQWWNTVRIYSEKRNGETKILCSTSTYWA